MKRLALVSALVLLASCAGPRPAPPPYSEKPQVSEPPLVRVALLTKVSDVQVGATESFALGDGDGTRLGVGLKLGLGDGLALGVGDASTVREGLERVASDYGADELIVVTITFDHAARRRSYELIASAFGEARAAAAA